MTLIPGYTISERICQDTRSILYRGMRQNDGIPVMIKIAAEEHPSARSLFRLRHEYEITRGLDTTGVIRPHALESYDGGLALVLEHVPGRCLIGYPAAEMTLEGFLMMAISLARAVDDLHQNNIIHKDINPYHIIMDQERWEVKLRGSASPPPCPVKVRGSWPPTSSRGRCPIFLRSKPVA